MKLTFLNAGDAFAFEQGHNSALLEFNNTNLVIDFPATNRHALRKMGKELSDIKNVFISHLHEDHINGIQQLAYFKEIVSKEKPNLYIAANLLLGLWSSIKEGLNPTTKGLKNIDDYFNVHLLEESKPFEVEGVEFEIVKTNHVPLMNSYGLLSKKNFYFSCDSNVDKEFLEKINEDVQFIFHDCHLWDLQIDSHASLEDIKALPTNIKEKIVLMHYQDFYVDENERKKIEDKEKIKVAYPLKEYTM